MTGARLDTVIHAAIDEHLLVSGPVLNAGDTAGNHLVLTILELMVGQTG